jgi:hypothetical protein
VSGNVGVECIQRVLKSTSCEFSPFIGIIEQLRIIVVIQFANDGQVDLEIGAIAPLQD